MKKIVLSAVMLGLGVQAFAQDMLYEAKIKKEEVPVVIITAVERDYPGFVMEEFTAVPLEYVENDVIIDKDVKSIADYDTFEISLSGKGQELKATYNREGNLISTMEHGKNVTPVAAVRGAIAKAYPGWSLSKDSYTMSHFTGVRKDNVID